MFYFQNEVFKIMEIIIISNNPEATTGRRPIHLKFKLWPQNQEIPLASTREIFKTNGQLDEEF